MPLINHRRADGTIIQIDSAEIGIPDTPPPGENLTPLDEQILAAPIDLFGGPTLEDIFNANS